METNKQMKMFGINKSKKRVSYKLFIAASECEGV